MNNESQTFGFSIDGSRLILNHPQLAVEWTWDGEGHVIGNRLDHLSSGASWLDAVAVTPLFVLGFARWFGRSLMR